MNPMQPHNACPNCAGEFDFETRKPRRLTTGTLESTELSDCISRCEILQEALDDPSTCDFTITSSSGKLPVHSLILRSRWPHFKLICSKELDVEGGVDPCLQLTQYPHEWIKALVDCIYGVDPKIYDFETLLKLMMLSEVYLVQKLQDYVNAQITGIPLTPELLCKLWKCAYTCDNKVLIKKCVAYYTSNVAEINECPEYEDLTRPELMALQKEVRRLQAAYINAPLRFGYSREHHLLSRQK